MTGSQIKYILTIYQLQNEAGARLTDIAAAMHISKPSVYQMIGQLSKLGLVESIGKGKYRLTEQGSAAAVLYSAQYDILFNFLAEKIGMQQMSAKEVAATLIAIDNELLEELCSCIQQCGGIEIVG